LNGEAGGAQFGFTAEQWRATRPSLSSENELVLMVWRFCGGWNPERAAFAAAYYGIEDVDTLLTQLLVVDSAINAHKAANRT
jgi:hypothetical protein